MTLLPKYTTLQSLQNKHIHFLLELHPIQGKWSGQGLLSSLHT